MSPPGEPTGLAPVSNAPLRERVADSVREAIISGRFGPGHRVTEAELSAQLRTSRAPVREALRQLEQEGLVVTYPYRGTEVVGVSQEEIDEVLVPVRLTLERYAIRKLTPTFDEEALLELQGIVDAMVDAGRHRDPDLLANLDVEFHEAVIRRSGQQHCLQLWRTIRPRVNAYFRRDAAFYDDASVVADQHAALLEALRSGDVAAVDAALVAHIRTHTPDHAT